MYTVTAFHKVNNHKKGAYNRDIKVIAQATNRLAAEKALFNFMHITRKEGIFARIDWNIKANTIVFGDCSDNGGVVRFRQRDGLHWSHSYTLQEFKSRILRLAHD